SGPWPGCPPVGFATARVDGCRSWQSPPLPAVSDRPVSQTDGPRDVLWNKHDLAALAAVHQFEAAFELVERKGVRHDRPYVEAGTEQTGEAVPGVEQPPTRDALDAHALEDHLVGDVQRHRRVGDAEQGDAAGVFHGAEAEMDRGGMAGHLQGGVD